MGVCESCNSDKNSLDEKKHKKFSTSDLSILDQNNQYILSKKNNYPLLKKYQRSFVKKSLEMNNSKSEFSSKKNEGEIIIKGEINKKCQNKEKDFNNLSFMKLIENNGGIIIKEKDKEKEKEKINNNNNNALIDFSKEKISEIKKDESLDIDSKITEKEFLNELRNKKFSNYSINTTKLMNYERCMKNDNKSNYSSKTCKHSMNISNYFTGKFNNSNNSNMLYNNKTYKNKKYNYITLNRANIFKSDYEKKSLFSNNNMTNESTSGDLKGSIISFPKNDERIPESELGIINNFEDVISNLSSEH